MGIYELEPAGGRLRRGAYEGASEACRACRGETGSLGCLRPKPPEASVCEARQAGDWGEAGGGWGEVG